MKTDEETAEATPKKKGKLRKVLGIVLALVVVGGAATGGVLYAQDAGLIQLGFLDSHEEPEDPNKPKLVPRDEAEGGFVEGRAYERADPRRFKASYYPLDKEFTSNLRGGEAFVQFGMGVSTYYDERVIEHVKLHEMAVRSAVLMTVADQDPGELGTPQGKIALQARLKKAVNAVLESKEGFGGIDDVYFTSFVMQ